MRYAGLATQWMVMLLAGVWLGLKLDRYIGWKFPLFTILFPLIALIVSLWGIIKEFNKKK
jgi:F0F1-type ATP synthase assembly protein I